jgi:hypothetical protein
LIPDERSGSVENAKLVLLRVKENGLALKGRHLHQRIASINITHGCHPIFAFQPGEDKISRPPSPVNLLPQSNGQNELPAPIWEYATVSTINLEPCAAPIIQWLQEGEQEKSTWRMSTVGQIDPPPPQS